MVSLLLPSLKVTIVRNFLYTEFHCPVFQERLRKVFSKSQGKLTLETFAVAIGNIKLFRVLPVCYLLELAQRSSRCPKW